MPNQPYGLQPEQFTPDLAVVELQGLHGEFARHFTEICNLSLDPTYRQFSSPGAEHFACGTIPLVVKYLTVSARSADIFRWKFEVLRSTNDGDGERWKSKRLGKSMAPTGLQYWAYDCDVNPGENVCAALGLPKDAVETGMFVIPSHQFLGPMAGLSGLPSFVRKRAMTPGLITVRVFRRRLDEQGLAEMAASRRAGKGSGSFLPRLLVSPAVVVGELIYPWGVRWMEGRQIIEDGNNPDRPYHMPNERVKDFWL